MRHQRSGKKLGRDSAHRKALYANLAGALIEHGRIRTTVTKAKAVRPIAEQMITLGRRGDLHARRQAVAFLRSKDVVHKLFDEVGPSFAARPGGYTRIIRIGPRYGDASEMAYLELVDTPLEFKPRARDRRAAEAVEAAAAPSTAAPEAEDAASDRDAGTAEATDAGGEAAPEDDAGEEAAEPGASAEEEGEAAVAEVQGSPEPEEHVQSEAGGDSEADASPESAVADDDA